MTELINWTSDVAGKILRWRGFDWVDDYIDFWNTANIYNINSDHTISIWIKTTTKVNQNIIFSSNNTDFFNENINIRWTTTLNWNRFNWSDFNIACTNFSNWAWTHLVVYYDASANKHWIYINWVFEADRASTLVPTTNWQTTEIGRWFTSNNSSTQYLWDLDEVGIWNTVLTQTDITTLYNSWVWLAFSNFTT